MLLMYYMEELYGRVLVKESVSRYVSRVKESGNTRSRFLKKKMKKRLEKLNRVKMNFWIKKKEERKVL